MKALYCLSLAIYTVSCSRRVEDASQNVLVTSNFIRAVVPPERSVFSATMDEPSDFMNVIHIWHCDDGSFEVRTELTSGGHYPTLDLAREAKTNWANEVSRRLKKNKASGETFSGFRKLPDCGKQVE